MGPEPFSFPFLEVANGTARDTWQAMSVIGYLTTSTDQHGFLMRRNRRGICLKDYLRQNHGTPGVQTLSV